MNSIAKFYNEFKKEEDKKLFKLKWSYIKELLLDGITPIRAISDVAIRYYLPYLHGEGTIYELSATGDYYKNFAPKTQKYIITNFTQNAEVRVDMTKMPFASNSVDAFISVYALEHIFDYKKGIDETYDKLKEMDRFLLVVPFMYCNHGAPDDYVRFSKSYINKLLNKFEILDLEAIGTRSLYISELFHEKKWMKQNSSKLKKFIMRCFSVIFVSSYIIKPKKDDVFYTTIVVLAQKPKSN
ncbi:methyltransferase domain-containing protein [Aliarcobacter cryaerophilus]|uniref:methyltransferase domain-containing protein n=1 Tax=Aliarcobacter cryaerophilus TaxID=28198 RepID=UPI0021B6856A|nr:methyltransferase domain-containing protein [Aliarcobacter cryaerophilus]MCT7528304.1 methyltransferase domain-containing protein [Aliarcobacter cryaerophilus]